MQRKREKKRANGNGRDKTRKIWKKDIQASDDIASEEWKELFIKLLKGNVNRIFEVLETGGSYKWEPGGRVKGKRN